MSRPVALDGVKHWAQEMETEALQYVVSDVNALRRNRTLCWDL